MIRSQIALFVVTLLCPAIAACGESGAQTVADSAFINGKIYTVNEKQTWAEAVAIKDGKFLLVGSIADVKAVTGKATKVIDLAGKMVMPGLHDTHVHMDGAYIAGMLGG